MSSKKSPKIAALIADCMVEGGHDPHYAGYFKCFNNQLYYEAHDVLEELWLGERKSAQAAYYQGLIQVAGAFVHLQKGRLAPASRLFALALKNLAPYPSHHAALDLEMVRRLCEEHMRALEESSFTQNPWSPNQPPVINLHG